MKTLDPLLPTLYEPLTWFAGVVIVLSAVVVWLWHVEQAKGCFPWLFALFAAEAYAGGQ